MSAKPIQRYYVVEDGKVINPRNNSYHKYHGYVYTHNNVIKIYSKRKPKKYKTINLHTYHSIKYLQDNLIWYMSGLNIKLIDLNSVSIKKIINIINDADTFDHKNTWLKVLETLDRRIKVKHIINKIND